MTGRRNRFDKSMPTIVPSSCTPTPLWSACGDTVTNGALFGRIARSAGSACSFGRGTSASRTVASAAAICGSPSTMASGFAAICCAMTAPSASIRESADSHASTCDFTLAGRNGPPRANQTSATPVERGVISLAPVAGSSIPARMPLPESSVAIAKVGAIAETLREKLPVAVGVAS
ncbi:MAG: hypothetical protein IPP98_12880 [Gemmatimonadetes bacterium]|nr:hypothetical protein [Gemmatimonadota bacterium]